MLDNIFQIKFNYKSNNMKSVAIITRTKNRPLTLKRALSSVVCQTFKDFQWVVVNDGGEKEPVEQINIEAQNLGIDVLVHHNEVSQGMEKASNIGLHLSDSKYVVIHDDDDTWEGSFLEKTVSYLESIPNDSKIKGVVTRSTKVIEIIHDKSIEVKKKFPYDANLNAITLYQMVHLHNVPPNLSFVYRRDVFDDIGYYREDLPVLGDWDFNIRFLSRYDVVVIPEYLANYHWRETLLQGNYSNTVVGKIDIHATYAAFLKNEWLRKDLQEGKLGLGFLVNISQDFQAIQNKLNPWSKIVVVFKKIFKTLYIH
jgi:glycosyltransferase involved in cell wall biosynthesis